MVKRIAKEYTAMTIEAARPVTVDTSLPLARMIAANGFEPLDPDLLADHPPIEDRGRRDVMLEPICIHAPVNLVEILQILHERRRRSGRTEEVLAFCRTYPGFHRQSAFAAIGSSWRHRDGLRHLPYLGEFGQRRCLHVCSLTADWTGGIVLAAPLD